MNTYPAGTKQKGLQNLTKGIREQPFSGWAPTTGNLQEVTKRGEYVGIHDHPNLITMGVLASSPSLLLPDLMIMAQVKKGVKTTKAKVKDLEITRLIPLHLVEIFVYNVNERQLKVKLATGRKYYLQLCAPKGDENFLFDCWMRLAYLLHVASGRISDPVSFTSKESGLHTIWKSASLRATSEKQPWLPGTMGAQSAEKLKEQLRQASLARSMSRTTESDLASQHSILKSGFASQGSVGISPKKQVAVKPSKRVTISGVIGPSGKSVPEEKKEEEEAGNPELHTVDNLRMDAGSSAAAMMGTDKDRPPPQSHASMGEGAPEAKSPAVGGGNSEAAEFSRPGSQIIAREPGVANVTSQKSDQIKDVGQPSTPHLEDQGCQVSGFLPESQGKRGRLWPPAILSRELQTQEDEAAASRCLKKTRAAAVIAWKLPCTGSTSRRVQRG
ncbi:uncharacterized protein LOC133377490 [Rhineura floridana]|uniref:uncharacterized protein LOC133377490 n=1 Tax=Rhineura floridana TaxID=261503 RepID=UPI002AC86AE9|nr:uncharacterized protein LOC133377490 [Rhineura floridana]